MEMTYELLKASRDFMQGRNDGLFRVYERTLDEVYFLLQFVMNDSAGINEALEQFYIKMSRNAFGLEKADMILSWITESVFEQTGEWIRKNASEEIAAEKRGAYKCNKAMMPYLPGIEIDGGEAIRALENFITELPVIHKQTALAYYYCNMPMEKITEVLETTRFEISERINFIEKTLTDRLAEYCKERGAAMPHVNTQRIGKAIAEISKLYRYPYAEELFEIIRIKAVH